MDWFLYDNGLRYERVNNNLLSDLSNQLNLFIITTTKCESPWSNGIRRHHAILGNVINKLLIDKSNNYSVDIIVPWAVSAKNALHNYSGFSQNQLIFSKNPNFLSILIDKPPALKAKTSTELIANHLNEMHNARKAFIAAEASEKRRRAIKTKI